MGMYMEAWNDLEPRLPFEVVICSLACLIHIALVIPIMLNRMWINDGFGNLESLLRLEFIITNSIIFIIIVFTIVSIVIVTLADLERINDFPNNIFAFNILFLSPSLSCLVAAIILLRKHGANIIRAIFQKYFNQCSGM